MLKKLFFSLIVFGFGPVLAQAPSWQWAADANSGNPESASDIYYDPFSSYVYAGGNFTGNLSAKYGSSFTASYGNTDGFLAKYDQSGNVSWALKIGGTGADEVTGVVTDLAGDVYVNGFFNGTADFDPSAATFTLASAGSKDGFLAKYSATGTFLWAVKFGGTGNDDCGKLWADANGIYITGSYASPPATFYSFGSGVTKTTASADAQINMFGAKYNSSGVAQWVISGGGDKDDTGTSVTADATYIYFLGQYESNITFKNAAGTSGTVLQKENNNKGQVYIIAITQSGGFGWQTNITCSSGGNEVFGMGLAQDASALYVTGYSDGDIDFKYPSPTFTQSNVSGKDLYLAKLLKTGTFSWVAAATGNTNGEQIGQAVGIDNSGNVILGGSFLNNLNYSSAGGSNYASTGAHDIFVTAYSNAGSYLWSVTAGGNARDYMNGLSVDTYGSIYVAGEEDGGMVIGTTTLTSGGGKNIFAAKLGCAIVTNNTIASSQTICAGSTPSALTGSVATGGTSYLWQMSLNSSTWTTAAGTATNQNYSPPALSATTYYRRNVSATGACSTNVSSSNTITISVDASPGSNAGSTQTVCATTATLAAINPTVGTGAWSVSGGGSVTSVNNPSSQVTALSTGTNSFVWTVSNGVCTAATSTVSIIRNAQPTANAGSNQTVCTTSATLAAISPTIGTGAWSVLSGGGSVTSVNNPSSQVTSLSTGTNSFVWTVSNGVCTAATSTVSIIRDAQPSSNAGTNQTICATTATLAAINTTVGTGAWSVLSGGGSVTSVSNPSSQVTALSTGTNSFVWTVSNGVCTAATSTVSIIRNAQPASNAGTNQTVCATTATLAAINPTVGSGAWSVLSGGGNVTSINNPSSQVTSLSTGTNSFVWTVSNGVCAAATSTVSIMRDAQPVSNAGTNQTVCATTATLAAINPTIGTGTWSVLSGGGNVTSVNNPSSQVTSLSIGTNSFVWTVSNGVCTAATSTVSIIRDAQPVSNAGANQTICATTATLTAINPTIGTGTWSVLSGGGNVTSVSNPSSQVTSLSTGTNSFVWTVSNGVCSAATSTVSIIRDAQPVSNAGANQTICATTATLAAINPTVGTGAWSVLSGGGNVTSVNNPSSQVTSLSTGTNSFIWTVSNGVCTAATSTVSIVRDAQPTSNAGTNQTICATTATLAAINPTIGTGAWSVIAGLGNVTSVNNPSSQVTSLSTGTNSFVWTVNNGVCAAATSTVSIMRDAQPVSNAGTNQTVCAATATLAATNPTVGTGAWSVLSGGGNVTSINNPSSQVTSLSTGTNSFVWTVSNGVCTAATSTVSIIRDAQPSSNAGTNQTVCATTATLAATNPTIGTGAWSVIAGSGNVTSINNPSSQVNSLSTGTNSFVWTVSNGVCTAATSTVSIIRDAQPASNAGANQTVCATAATLAATNPTVGTGAWSVLSGGGSVTSVNNPSSQVTSLSTGTNSFVWTVSNGVCTAATSTVSIIRDVQPTANAGSNQTLCATTATLAATNPTIGTGAWSVLSGGGNVTSVNNPSSQVTSLSTGTNSFVWTVSNGVCAAATSTVSIIRDAQPSSNAGSNQTLCATTVTLAATNPTVGTGAWSVLSGGGNVTSVNNPSSQVTSLSTGNNSFVWTVSNGVCTAATSTVSIIRDAQPTSNAGANQTLCATIATLAAINPTVGTGAWSVIAGSGNVTSVNNPSSQVTSLSTGTNSFVWTVSNGVCTAATSTVSIIRDAQPVSNAGTNQTVCATTATLAASNPTIGTGAWSVLSGAGNITSVNNPSSQVTSLSTGTNSFVWTVSNGVCTAAISTVSIIRDVQPSSNAGTNQTICATTATLAASNPTVGTGAWSVLSGGGNVTSVNNPSSQVTSLSTGTNSFIWTVSNGVCSAATSTVSIIRDAQPTSNAGANQTLCATIATLAAINPTVGTGAWSVIVGSGNVTSVNNPSSQVTSLSTGTNSFVWTVSNGVCTAATSTVSIIRNAQPASNAGTNQTVCATTATLAAINPTIGTGAWSVLSGGGSVTSVNNPSSQVTSLSTGTNSFVWTVSNGVCTAASSTVSIIRDGQPTSNAGTNQTVCATTATLAASNPTIGTGAWSVLSGGGNVTSVNNPSSQVTALSTGPNSFVWTVSNGVCTAATSTVSIIRDAQPNSNAGTNQTICATTATLAASNPTIGTGAWSVLSGGGNVTSVNNPSSQVTALSTGPNSFVWTVSNGVCTAATSTVSIVRDAQPTSNAGTNQTVCATTATLAASNPTIGTGAWSVLSGGGNVTSVNNPSSQVTSLSNGNNSFVWTISNGVCTAATSTVSIIRDAQPSSNAGANQTLCATIATLAAINPTIGTGAWSVSSGGGNVTSVNNPSSQVTSLSTGTNSFVWTVSNGVCTAATSTVSIIRDAQPTSNAGSNQTVCATTATLAASNPTIGTGAWSVLSGGGNVTSVNNPSSQVTSLSTGTNSFVWTVSNGVCTAATSTVSIMRDAQPTANAGSNQTICSANATLAAINPTVGTGVWSVIAGSGNVTSVNNSSSQVTSLSTGTNSFVWTVSNGVCAATTSTVSIIRDAQPTSNAGTNQTVCATTATLAATNPTIGTGAWSVLSGGGSVTSVNNPSSQVTSLSTGTNSFVWTVSNGVCTAATSTVSIIRDAQPNSNAGTNQTICATTATLAATNPTIGTGAWSVLSGGGSITSVNNPSSQVTALSTGPNSFVWTVSNGVCTAATSTVSIVRDAQPTSNAGTNQTVCATTATLAATNPTIGTGAWSVLSGGGNVTSVNNPSSQVTSLSTGTNSFVWTVSNGVCTAATSTVSIIRDAQPNSNAGSNQTVCATTATLAAISPTIGTGAWSVLSGGGNVTSVNNASSQVTSLSTGTNSFVWTVSNGVCATATSTVLIIRDAQPTANAGSNQTICATTATLAAINPTIGTGAWSIIGGSGNVTSINNPSSQVTSLGTGTNSFVWTVSNGVCTAATSTVSVVRDAQPTANAGVNQTVCAAAATLNALNPAVGTGIWSVLSGGASIASANSYSSQVTSLSTGTNAFAWTVSNGICASSSSTVIITLGTSLTANAGSNQTVCASSATLNAVGSGTWTVASGSGSVVAPNNPSSPVISLSPGDNSFVWTIPDGGCTTIPATVTITRNSQPTSNAGSNQTVCASSATLNASNPSDGTGAWSLSSGSGNIISPNSYSSEVTSLGTGTNSFIWTVSNGFCAAVTSTALIIRDSQPSSNAGVNQTLCATTATLAAITPTVGNGVWSVLSGGGNITSINNPSSQVTSLSTGTNSFVWTVNNGVCTAATSTVSIIRDAQPVSNAGTNQTICAGTATLAAINPIFGSGAWSVMAGSGNITSVNNPSSQVTTLSTGTNSFIWTVSNGVCTSAASTVAIIRDVQPVSNAGSNQTLCATIATLAAINPTVGTGAWSVIAGSGNITSINNPSSQVTSLSTGTNSFVWTVSNGVCTAATSTVSIIKDAQPISNAGTNQTLCATTATLAATNPTIGSGAWSVLSGGGNVTSVNSPSSQITSLSTGTNSFVWTVSNGVCTSATSTVSIIRDAQPISNAGSNQTLCATTATLAAINPTIGSGSWSVLSGSGNVTSVNNPSSQVTSLITGTNSFVWTVSNGVCTAATSTVSIIRDAQPSANAGANQTICAGTATLAATSTTIGTGAWSVLSGGGNVTSISNPSSQVTSLGTGTNSFIWTVSNGSCPSATALVNIVRDTQPIANAGSDQTVCISSATLNAVNPSIGTGNWTVSSGSGILTSPNSYSTAVTSLSTGNNSFVWTVSNGVCPASTSTVILTRGSSLTANAGSNQTVCTTSATLNAVGSGTWSVAAGSGNVTSINNPLSQVTALSSGINSFIWTISNGSCPTSPATVTITREIQPTANAGSNQTICASIATLSASNPTVGTGTWSVITGSGNITSVTNPSSQVTALSTGTNSFVWTVNNGVCTAATSTVSIIRDALPTSNAGTNQIICATTATLAAISPTIGTGAWSVLSGSGNITSINSSSSQVTSLGTGTNSFVWTVSNGVCAAATSTVSIIRDAQPVSNAGSNQTVCATIATLAATNSTAGTGAWSLLSGSGNITSISNASSQVTSLNTGTNSFVWTVNNGVCPAATSTVTITRDAQPVSNAGSSQTLCTTSATLAAINPTAGTGNWSVIAGSGNVTSISNPSSQITALGTGTNSFIWTVSNGVCTAATSTVSIIRDAQPVANAGIDQTLCTATTTMNAVNPGVGTGTWSILQGGSTVSSPNNPLSTITALSTGTNAFVWTVANGVCIPATSTVIIIRDAQPIADAGSSQTVCATSATMNAVNPTIGTGVWSVLQGSSTVSVSNDPLSPVTALSTGTNSFIWTVSNGSCPAATGTVDIISESPLTANAGSNQTICATSATLNAAGSGTWSVISGSCSVTAVNNPSSQVTALSSGINSFAWSVSGNSCPVSTATISITSDEQPTAFAGSNQTICASDATLSADTPTIGTGNWSVINGASIITTASNPTSAVTSLATGTNVFVWTVSNGSCPPATATVIIDRAVQPIAAAGNDQTVCATGVTLTAANFTTGTGSWSVIAGTANISSPGNPITAVTALSTGTTMFVWTVSNSVCPAARDSVIIQSDAAPTPANAGTDQRVCGSTLTVSGNAPLTGTGQWKVIDGAGNFSNIHTAQTTVTNLSTGINTLAWVISNGSCPVSGDTVLITSDEAPSAAIAGDDVVTCTNGATLSAVVPQTGTGTWSLLSGSGTFTSASATAITVSLTSDGDNVMKWSVKNGVCQETADTVIVTKTSGFGKADAGTDKVVETSAVELNAQLPRGAIGKWSVILGNSEVVNISDPATEITKLSFGNNIFRWSVSGGSCPESSDDVIVFVKDLMIPNGFSPNGDGINDRFIITSLNYYSNVKFSVYNRWGALLYENADYKNEWAGTNQANEKLTDDTYYYVLEIPELKNFTGFIIVKQNK